MVSLSPKRMEGRKEGGGRRRGREARVVGVLIKNRAAPSVGFYGRIWSSTYPGGGGVSSGFALLRGYD